MAALIEGAVRSSIFERYGGFGTLNQVVVKFYDKVLESEIVSPYFDGVNMQRLIDHQTKFIATVTGGPAHYPEEMLGRVHQPFDISESAFAEIARILQETLEEFGMEPDDVHVIRGEFLKRRTAIVASGDDDPHLVP